ncbi:MAG: oxygen-independent coproporphyrinogen III oxidase [Bacteriovoracaceae bacterium]|jgi:oxygen-independent coproporphyrinogen III oxidase|nr:oxygen-independent coproporphyrinogen III oxidase [Bacteriovoracaceae bacterium]
MLKVLRKLDRPVPRYTSYPPVPHWNKKISSQSWLSSIQKNNIASLYIHIPFCEQLCYYCGCFKKITKNKSIVNDYIQLIKAEWEIYLKNNPRLKIQTIHIGGGTPSFLSPKALKDLLAFFSPFMLNEAKNSIELDPRTTCSEQLQILKEFKFDKVSLGIQDFDVEVQNTINRVQPYDLVEKLVKKIRQMGFSTLGFDLIYGLPKQSMRTIQETLEQVLVLNPDQIAYYSYAHLPQKIKSQRIFAQDDLPNSESKKNFFYSTSIMLEKAGYIKIGLDHFVKKDSPLYMAKQNGKLTRNFMGYSELETPLLIGLGVSSISESENYFVQNTKSFSEMKDSLDKKELSLVTGHKLSDEDSMRAESIQNLMCNEFIDLEKITYEELRQSLEEFVELGLLEANGHLLKLTERGRPYLRVIASCFDEYLGKNKVVQFSQSI